MSKKNALRAVYVILRFCIFAYLNNSRRTIVVINGAISIAFHLLM